MVEKRSEDFEGYAYEKAAPFFNGGNRYERRLPFYFAVVCGKPAIFGLRYTKKNVCPLATADQATGEASGAIALFQREWKVFDGGWLLPDLRRDYGREAAAAGILTDCGICVSGFQPCVDGESDCAGRTEACPCGAAFGKRSRRIGLDGTAYTANFVKERWRAGFTEYID